MLNVSQTGIRHSGGAAFGAPAIMNGLTKDVGPDTTKGHINLFHYPPNRARHSLPLPDGGKQQSGGAAFGAPAIMNGLTKDVGPDTTKGHINLFRYLHNGARHSLPLPDGGKQHSGGAAFGASAIMNGLTKDVVPDTTEGTH